ncbi:carboxylesterase/lipase family protein [Kribbella deserti]|uniref:Carboxylic ester hydrolase n=1 Tax=Kribbella deserti TaxID=1926257 RepID=A0ABV6QPK1_9ACTN
MQPTVVLSTGKIRGRTVGGVSAFLGIPYAEAPIGPWAFAAPRPVRAWDGVRDAITLGPTAPQPSYQPPYDQLLANPFIDGPDFLNLNVWAPADSEGLPSGEGLPVMVWLHGGAFRNGSNAVPTYDGTAFARDGVVLVSANYRLGVQGFGVVRDAPANRGLLDQLAALAWVQENAAVFGGDPARVTVFGESAGGMSVATLVSMPAARGLFHRAIVQSGSAQAVAEQADAANVTLEVAKRLGVEPTAEGLGSVAVPALIAAQGDVAAELRARPDPQRWGRTTISAGFGVMPFFPVIDGRLISRMPLDAIIDGEGRDVDLLTGTTSDEFRLFMVPTGVAAGLPAEALPQALAQLGIDPALAGVYAANRPRQSPGDVLAAIVTDGFFTMPTVRLADAHASTGGKSFMYEFAWPSPLGGLGACHALEIGFVFDTLGEAAARLTGPNPPQSLADEVHGAWVSFAATGDPGWGRYGNGARPVLRFDHPESCQVENPRPDELARWQ